jgi:hypothetical protein
MGQFSDEDETGGPDKRKKFSTEDKSRQRLITTSFGLTNSFSLLYSHPSANRNRAHARNTRLRKKAFMQKLQDLCENLTAQRNKEIEDRLALGKRIYLTVRPLNLAPPQFFSDLGSQQELRMETVKKFLRYRSNNVQDYSKLSALLDDSFTMTIPITPYMSFNKTEVVNR